MELSLIIITRQLRHGNYTAATHLHRLIKHLIYFKSHWTLCHQMLI